MKKRVVIISDLHSGHLAGLTPPSWQVPYKGTSKTKRNKWARLQRDLWKFYADTIENLGKIHVLVVNGDAIDGPGKRSGGTELITTDPEEQCDMAVAAIRTAMSRGTKVIMTYGTPYHSGEICDYEEWIAREVNAEKIGGHEWITVEGVTFDLKHKIGASGIPHGRHSGIAKERLWQQLWSEQQLTPKSDVIVRSHVHYFGFCGGKDWLGLTTPALQGAGSKYGARQCSGLVNFGLTHFDAENGGYSWKAHLANLECQKSNALVL